MGAGHGGWACSFAAGKGRHGSVKKKKSMMRVHKLSKYKQWNLSIADTLGIAENVLISEVSSFQG